ncbi:hypothetical protein LAZ67_21001138 [Cordylochernes scorpioides]|uniref:Uncharacterized protein n=1 Tax=Cordylochernes scorpioides TaxID=51811 RepID=A0ABY6LLS2_9ARAC|nr:hypothetical protein LAZ67_21001138 [Cordylochernes scorpioides]
MASLPSHDVTLNKLDGYNYSLWSFKIEMLLQKEDLWEVVTENIPDEPKIEWKKKDSKARAIINLSIADSQIVHVKNLLTAKATWDTLKNIYERKTLSGKIYLLRKLYSLKLEEDKDMQQHITTMMELVDKLRTIGETLKDSHITAILLCSLPKSYTNLITMLESRPDDELTLEFTKNKLLDEHTRRVESSKDESTGSKALKSLHGASSQRREKEKKFCSFRHKPNHSKEECWHYQKRNNSNKEYKYENFRRGNVPKYTNQSSVTQEQPTNQRTTKGPNLKALNCTQREASVHNWFIDSGATSHMAYDESFFTELNREQTQNVVVANGKKLQVKGIGQGEIKVITPQGKTDTLLLTKVLYIPELTDNLLSVSAATSNGCKVTFNRDWCTIERDNTALANGILDNGMYRLHLDDNPQTRTFKANVAKQNHCKNKNCLMLWHDRLGHRNIESIKKIRNENLARGLSLNNCSHSTDCVQCIQGKLTETPFPKKTEYRATETLQLVHSDICGPLPTNSLSGKRYFITFTDDYSRYTKIYLLKGKDEAYEKIKDYVISAHTEFGKNIQTIRTDNGREYVNRQVEDFLNQSGIKHQLTVPYSPAQNGVAERKNRSLMEMTRCMLFDSGLPQSLWAEAVTTANYLHNRIPSKATDKTPFELWTNRKPSLKHLKRFGCKAFAYIPKIKRNKLDSKVIEGIFLGYDDRSKGYRILHDTDNITISRSVKFLEKENGFHHASTKTTSPQVLSTDLTSSNHIGNAEESQEPGTQPENLEDSETEDYLQPGTSTGTQVVTQRRSTRPTKGIPPIRNDYMLYKTEAQDIPTPTSYSEVLQLPKIEREKWLQAMNEELNSLEKNHVWELTPLPKDKKIIGSFLHGDLDKELYMELPEGLHTKQTNKVCKLKKEIYGLKQAGRSWNTKIASTLIKNNFKQSIVDPCLFTKNEENHSIYLILYVDDMLLASDSEIIIQNTVKTLEKEFEIKNLGDPTQFIGIEISRNREGELLLSQKNKIQELVERYNLQEAKPTFTPMESGYPGISDEKLLPNNVQYQQLIGSLLYLSVVSRPDIAAPVCILSSRNQNPRNCDWNAAKRIVRYLKTTKELELRISKQKPPTLEAYSDATWASDNTDRKSLSGNLFLLGSNPISWMTGKQGCVSLSSTEAELISAAEASQELLWLLDLLKDLELEQKAPIYFHQDNQSCLKICSSEKVSSRTKHIATKIHHLKDLQKKTVIKMVYCPTGDMKADILTKPLPRPTFEKLRYNLVISTLKRDRDREFPEIEEALFRWIRQANAMKLAINGNILKEKAILLALKMGQHNFEASNGWLEKFKARRNIAFKRLHGEAGSVDANSVATWKGGIIPSLLAKYSPQDIFNADETGLFYKLLPNQTMTIRDVQVAGEESIEVVVKEVMGKEEDEESLDEMMAFIGGIFNMGNVKKNQIRDYWSKNELLETPWFGKVMSRGRFELLYSCFYLIDDSNLVSSSHPDYNPTARFEMLIEHVNNKFIYYYKPTQNLTVDESLHHGRFGVKLWMLCESKTGYCLRMKPYKGKLSPIIKSLSYDVPMNLLQGSSLLGKGYHLITDNFFTSINLAKDLLDSHTYLTGTIRTNRKGLPKTLTSAKLGVDESLYMVNNNLLALAYKEKKSKPPVKFLSTFCDASSGKKRVSDQRDYPQMKICYDSYMGGVDLNDQMLYTYMDERKGRTFYRKVILNIFHRALLNSFILYEQHTKDNPKLSRRAFNYSVINELVKNHLKPPVLPSTSQEVLEKFQKRERNYTMRINPQEKDLLLLHQFGFLAQKRLARGLRLNYPEATALLASQVVLTSFQEPLLKNIAKSVNRLPANSSVTVQWLPAHVGIPGNELADSLAKAGALGLPEARESTIQLDERDLLCTIKIQCLQEWKSDAAHD